MYINTIGTLLSLKKRNDYPMYSMTYYGDYGFDDFITQGATNDDDLIQFIQQRLTGKKKVELNVPKSGCTTFIAKEPKGDILFARNYDFPPTPSLVVKTNPKNGYASVSVVDLMALGYSMDNLPKSFAGKLPLLASPYLPFDGMNEKGLAVAILQVPETNLPSDPNKVTLNTTTTIRLLLDKAATVDEAVVLINKYNIYFSINVYCHFFIADSKGESVIVEYCDGKVHITKENIASNFYACNGVDLDYQGETPTPSERYRTAKQTLMEKDGILTMAEAGSLLCDLGIYKNNKDILQWSAVYNLQELKGMVFPGRDMSHPYMFHL